MKKKKEMTLRLYGLRGDGQEVLKAKFKIKSRKKPMSVKNIINSSMSLGNFVSYFYMLINNLKNWHFEFVFKLIYLRSYERKTTVRNRIWTMYSYSDSSCKMV